MRAKRNDVEEKSAAEREIALTRIILAWVLVLIILFWITSTPSPTESASVQFLIRGSLGAPHAMVAQHAMVWTDPKQVALWWGPKGLVATIDRGEPAPQFEMMASFVKEGQTRVAMRMFFVPADGRDHNVRE
jgi:hypothetical protein